MIFKVYSKATFASLCLSLITSSTIFAATSIPTFSSSSYVQEDKYKYASAKKLKISGNKAISGKEIQSLVDINQPFNVYDTVNTIEDYYRKKGFILVDILVNEVAVERGILDIKINEGYVDKIIFSNRLEYPDRLIKKMHSYLKNITNKRPLDIKTLEKYILLTDELPGVSIESEFLPSDNPDAVDLSIKIVKSDNFNFWTKVTNEVSHRSGPVQAEVAAKINTPESGRDFTFVLNRSIVGKRQLVSNLEYNQFIGEHGFNFKATASMISTKPKGGSNKGKSNRLTMNANYPLWKSIKTSFYLFGEFDINNSRNENITITSGYFDRIRSLRFGFKFSDMDNFSGNNVVSLQASKGLSFLGGSKESRNLPQSRLNADGDYLKLSSNYTRTQYLPSNFMIDTAFSAQYSFNALLTSEEFSYNGIGYESSVLDGDSGVSLTVTGKHLTYLEESEISLIPYVVYDLGYVDNTYEKISINSNDNRKTATAASYGLGFTLTKGEFLNANISIGFPISLPSRDEKKSAIKRFSVSLYW